LSVSFPEFYGFKREIKNKVSICGLNFFQGEGLKYFTLSFKNI